MGRGGGTGAGLLWGEPTDEVWFHLLGGRIADVCSLIRAPFGGNLDGTVLSVGLGGTEDVDRCGARAWRARWTPAQWALGKRWHGDAEVGSGAVVW